MKKRPLCLVCIGLMTVIFLMKAAGFPVFGEPAGKTEIGAAIRAGEAVHVTGEIDRREKTANAVRYYLKHTFLFYQNQKIPLNKIYVMTQAEEIFPAGASVRVSGTLEQPELPGNPGQFNAREYYACQKIYYCMWGDSLELVKLPDFRLWEDMARLRESLTARTAELVPARTAGILAAMLWGDKSLLEEESSLNFQFGGMIHILSISGSHITILGLGIFRLARRILRRQLPAAATAAAGMGLYCLFAGAQAATVRAYIMFAAGLGARLLGRSYDMICALSLSGILILLENPGYLFYSGFQLSFMAVLGIATAVPAARALLPEQEGFRPGRLPKAVRRWAETLISCGVIWFVTLPLSAFWFYEIPLWGVWVNLLLLPLMEPVMILGLAGSAAGLLWPGLGKWLLFCPARILEFSEKAMSFLRLLPGGLWICGQPSVRQTGAVLSGMALTVFYLGRKTRGKKNLAKKRAAAAVMAVLLWAALFVRPPEEFSITALDVGQGDCLVLETGRASFLVDGGSSSEEQAGRYRILPYLKQQGIRRVEGIFITHPDQDHTNGILEILEAKARRETQLSVGNLLLPEWMRGTREEKELTAAAGRADIPVRYLKAGDQIRSGDCRIEVLYPKGGMEVTEGEENSASLVLGVHYRSFDALLTGDLEGDGEEALLGRLGSYEYLKVAHHGSKNSTGQAFLKMIKPEICVISAPEHSVYGHPHPEVLERIKEEGGRVFVTAACGAVKVSVSGEKIRVETWKKPG